MNELTVQWALLREWNYLRRRLDLPIVRRVAENWNTEYGRLDFVLETATTDLAVVELETGIDTSGKLDFCLQQVTRYQKVNFHTSRKVLYVILYAEDTTPSRFAGMLQQGSDRVGAILRTYSFAKVQDIFQRLLSDLSRNVGISLGPTVAMDVCYLRWLNAIVKVFVDQGKEQLPISVVQPALGRRTTYGVKKRLAEDFDLLVEMGSGASRMLGLTDLGKRFAKAMIPDFIFGHARIPSLSTEQRRILLEALTNGRITPCKANIIYFLRFLHMTEGTWVPKSSAPEDPERMRLVTAFLGKSYAWKTVTDFLAFTCNQC